MQKYFRKMILLVATLCLLLTGCGQSAQSSETLPETPSAGQSEQAEQPSADETENTTPPSTEVPEEETSEQEIYTDNFSVDQAAVEAFAQEIQAIVADKDLEGLADLMVFPNYVGFSDDPQFVDTREEFLALGADRVFTEDLLTEISTADTTALEPSQAGFALSASGCPNIVFGVSEGHLAIVGINY